MLWGLQSCSPHWDTSYWCFGFERKSFLSTIFLIINVHPWNETNLDAHNNQCSFHFWHYNHILCTGMHDIDSLDLQEKAFRSTIFLIINVPPWNVTNLATQYNLHSFHYGYCNRVLHIGIHDIDALDFQEKLFFHHFP